KMRYSSEVVKMYRKKLVILENARDSRDLRMFKSLHFERLTGNKLGLYSIRVNDKYRLEFLINNEMDIVIEEIIIIEELSNHYK
ncbi:MAG TPA: type II toxin-antitoxin system RelE/ParE family toxin, partial [Hanamia sp.]|nr:type II toxin-antitoxin system RelE/ParE family toxin [Hanamia sp.]